ncbi:glycosyltransferase family 4 protein [Aetokthonos hydrillicola Thurmond2011]|jgi:glycosyltransferase involved in cell wall biosynthesis|uniref:Glycosyltransferase family 4 protein n=1 Tax=Aetokthonos hydrillicola Thurmond2011 TaxID=2712845 RepID=A0AAP5M8U2_9CYAN|nr:glycosyltransferase [Aetokthonos hydrillicola]MBO3459832.1 glycosyltransferase [Aetokthonos hydrillicola CCALA 1050]MBW4584523.1 glycosyltransferase family 4 protein [Aetokthonos hydrillicola CCALA 1050]MDR9895067.1 glycosyltransferase family 4 protein [Aetokthonos hydrillicola Thurmond2011]
MKITLVCQDIPYPPNHGARVDIWRRIKAFSKVGVQIQLISWYRNSPKPEEIVEIEKYVKEIHLLPFKSGASAIVRRLIDLLTYPLEVTSRIVRGKELSKLVKDVSVFQPHVIWLDGIHAGEFVTELSEHLNIPIITRSHNIEHLYYRRLLGSTRDFRCRLKRYFSVSHLEGYEKSLLKNSALFYDISVDDLKFWQDQGFTNGRYLPPIVEFSLDKSLETNSKHETENSEYDIVFLGNLYTDNNVAGIVWFITQILPLILSKLPNVKVLIAGSNPVKEIRKLSQEQTGVHLSINPVSSAAVYNSGRVLINPVLVGSGVSIKSIEMLSAGKPIVSTPQGVAGLPEEVKKYFQIAESAESFAGEIINLLTNSQKVNIDRTLLESLFGYEIIESVVSDIKSLHLINNPPKC